MMSRDRTKPEDIQAIVELIDETRLLYNALLDLLGRLHADDDLTPSQRAVLEYLYRNGDTEPYLAPLHLWLNVTKAAGR